MFVCLFCLFCAQSRPSTQTIRNLAKKNRESKVKRRKEAKNEYHRKSFPIYFQSAAQQKRKREIDSMQYTHHSMQPSIRCKYVKFIFKIKKELSLIVFFWNLLQRFIDSSCLVMIGHVFLCYDRNHNFVYMLINFGLESDCQHQNEMKCSRILWYEYYFLCSNIQYFSCILWNEI